MPKILTRLELEGLNLTPEKIEQILTLQEDKQTRRLKYEVFLSRDELNAIRETFPGLRLRRPGYAILMEPPARKRASARGRRGKRS